MTTREGDPVVDNAADVMARAVLDERARLLARPIGVIRAGATVELLHFAIGGERFAVEARFVAAIVTLHDVTPLPGAPPPLRGLSAFRGDVLTLLDARALVGAPTSPANPARVVVLGEERPAFGLLADQVDELADVPLDALHPPGAEVVGADLIRAIAAGAVLVLDAPALLHRQAGTRRPAADTSSIRTPSE